MYIITIHHVELFIRYLTFHFVPKTIPMAKWWWIFLFIFLFSWKSWIFKEWLSSIKHSSLLVHMGQPACMLCGLQLFKYITVYIIISFFRKYKMRAHYFKNELEYNSLCMINKVFFNSFSQDTKLMPHCNC